MNNYAKGVIIGFLFGLIALCVCFLFHSNIHEATIFLAQSIIDNAIFCVMFIIVVTVTGISC